MNADPDARKPDRDGVECPLPVVSQVVAGSLSADVARILEESGCLLAPVVRARLDFEKLLADLSARFINLPADRVDSQIESALESMVGFLDADRGSLAEVLAERGELVITHSYHRPGTPPQQHRVNLNEQLPWYAKMIQAGQVFRVSRLPDELPPEARSEREYCARIGMKSHVMIPMKVMGSVVGAIGFAAFRRHRDWPDDLIQRLRLVGEVFTNALERRRADQAVRRAGEQARVLREELAHATRLELVSHLAMSIAHEVNQPLCAIASNAQTALELLVLGDHEEARQALKEIWEDARRGSEVIGRIRRMVRKEDSNRTPASLTSIIGEITPLLRREAAAHGVRLDLDLVTRDAIVVCDRVQLQQVLFNVVLNAVDAVRQQSVGPPLIQIRTRWGGRQAVIVEVEDSGAGLSAEDCERVFTPFFTTKEKGLGMGLAICQSIMLSHGGAIWATRGVDSGTIFHLRLPATAAPNPGPEGDAAGECQGNGR